MRVLLIFIRETPYNSEIVRTLPCGGTEKSAIFLAEALHLLGHDVCVATTWEQYVAYRQQDFQCVITQDATLLGHFPNAKRVWWLHQFADTPYIQNGITFARMFADQSISLSVCQQKQFVEMLNLPTTMIPHGVWHHELAPRTEKIPYSMIYASTPFRGLDLLPNLFRQIREFQLEATLTVCSSMKTYGWDSQDVHYQALYDELNSIDGIRWTGSLNQIELNQEFAKTSIFLYPCTYSETYGMVMDEAIAHGCIPVITELGALPERFPAAGKTPEQLLQMVRYLFENPGIQIGHFRNVQPPMNWLEIGRRWHELVLTT